MPAQHHRPDTMTATVLRSYFVVLYLAVFAMISLFWGFADTDSAILKLLLIAASASHAALYTLIPVGLTWAVQRINTLVPGLRYPEARILYPLAYLGGSLVLIALYADYRVYTLYDYHLNGFVWNLVSTRGGIDALGATHSTMLTVALQVGAFLVANALTLWGLHYLHHATGRSAVSARSVRYAAITLIIGLCVGEIGHAYSVHTGQEGYLQASDVIPFRFNTTASGTFNRLGIERTALTERRIASGEIAYPGRHLEAKALDHYPNVIMLVGESFRWDLLNPEITPNLWAFSQQALRFDQHYSGGNRTRMGLFSMFYGLYAPYWYSFERQRVAPALMNFLRDRDYQLALHTSQSFDYPELRHTVFTDVPEQYMQELQQGEPWRRDRQNISDLIDKLDQRDPQRPFYGFMFFESTHAPYTFPPEAVIRPDFEPELDYLRMNLQTNIDRIHARYINAAHHVDNEVGRLLDYLKQHNMLDNTIVLFTGDHGEEFMEKGHWGHGRDKVFPEEQIRVPLVLWMPGQAAKVVQHRTSHLQISPTLLTRLGVTQPPLSYSSATDLFTPMPYFVTGGYDYMAVFDEHYKITFPFTGSDYFRYLSNNAQDQALGREDARTVVARYQGTIDAVVEESQRFLRKRSQQAPPIGLVTTCDPKC
ncbi:sulfatase-like hydrolase/transferase [Parazoarcus communis]|nr:sulfatase-like hydrolase/transferase [Parazoarcus communis]